MSPQCRAYDIVILAHLSIMGLCSSKEKFMNQPDLGLKVSELRQQKNLTQEQLAVYCEVSARTIQRNESCEVEPRSFTRNSLSNILQFDFRQERSEAVLIWNALENGKYIAPSVGGMCVTLNK